MVVDTLLDGSIVAELLIRLIIMMQTVRLALGQPLLAALDAEIVVACLCQVRLTSSRLDIHLRQRH